MALRIIEPIAIEIPRPGPQPLEPGQRRWTEPAPEPFTVRVAVECLPADLPDLKAWLQLVGGRLD